jgi:hypothetical protein
MQQKGKSSIFLSVLELIGTAKSHSICSMEKSVQSWQRRIVFFDHLITLSALANTFG